MINQLFYGDNYPVKNLEVVNNKNIINMNSLTNNHICPICKTKSDYIHSSYIRKIQDTPIHNMETWLYIETKEFECINENCSVKTFVEDLPFVSKHKVMTDALVQFILGISIFMSSSSTSLILSFLGVKISADTIDNLIKRIKIIDNPDVEEVGIDDVAIRKGQTYATAIYDLKDHHLIALLDGRDAESVKDFLVNHKKIKVVTRDRASAYATAINDIFPNCMQVADRFHLFQNLIEYLKEIFYKEVPDKIFIKNNEIIEKVKKVPSELVNIDQNILNKLIYDNTPPVDEKGNIIIFDNKRRDLDSKQYVEQTKNRKIKQQMIIKLREKLEYSDCHQTKDIAKEFRISLSSLRKYKKMTEEEVIKVAERNNYKKGKTLMDGYYNIIYKMLKDNISQEYIMAYVIKKGYTGSMRYLKDYINLIAKNNGMKYNDKLSTFIKEEYPSDVIVITRRDLLKYILTLDENKKDSKIEEYLEIIIKQYPIVYKIQNIFKDFHNTIFSKKSEELDKFIKKYEEDIPTFCKGIKKDIAPIKNAISYSINSGFVEGNNNKFKLIKRIVYGKMKLVNLSKKCYLSFLSTLDSFDLNEIVTGILNYEKE